MTLSKWHIFDDIRVKWKFFSATIFFLLELKAETPPPVFPSRHTRWTTLNGTPISRATDFVTPSCKMPGADLSKHIA
jgi:hypothetical protein